MFERCAQFTPTSSPTAILMNARSIAQTGPTAKRPVGKVAGFLGIVVMLIATHRPIPTWPKSRQCSGGQVRDNV